MTSTVVNGFDKLAVIQAGPMTDTYFVIIGHADGPIGYREPSGRLSSAERAGVPGRPGPPCPPAHRRIDPKSPEGGARDGSIGLRRWASRYHRVPSRSPAEEAPRRGEGEPRFGAPAWPVSAGLTAVIEWRIDLGCPPNGPGTGPSERTTMTHRHGGGTDRFRETPFGARPFYRQGDLGYSVRKRLHASAHRHRADGGCPLRLGARSHHTEAGRERPR